MEPYQKHSGGAGLGAEVGVGGGEKADLCQELNMLGRRKHWHMITWTLQKHRCDQEACKRTTHILLLRGTRVKAGSWQGFLRYFPLNKTTNLNKLEPQTRGTETEGGKPNTVSYLGLNALSTTLNFPILGIIRILTCFPVCTRSLTCCSLRFPWEARRWHSYKTLRTVLPAASAAEACSSVLGLESESDGLSPSEV